MQYIMIGVPWWVVCRHGNWKLRVKSMGRQVTRLEDTVSEDPRLADFFIFVYAQCEEKVNYTPE